jgi:tetraacyldisaccharide 4'-kinase
MTTESSILLAPMTTLYGAITETRLALYRRGILKPAKLAVPVISVGNITTGGTGKTPLVEYIARVVADTGRKVCILTRGYGRENPNHRVLVSDGHTVLAGHREAGDEPTLLAESLLGIAAVVSDADRFAAGQWAIKELGAEVFILDDGFQHLQLARNFNVAVIDATNPWGAGHLLPRGRLRERPRGLARADCIVLTRADKVADLESLKLEIAQASNHRPLIASRMRVRALRQLLPDVASHTTESSPEVSSQVAAFAGIGNQSSFVALLKDQGYDPVAVSEFPDHYRYNQGDIDIIVEKAKSKGANALVTTAKDAVKLRGLSFQLPCYVVKIEVCIEQEATFVEMLRAAID